jgi:hypothetical protein
MHIDIEAYKVYNLLNQASQGVLNQNGAELLRDLGMLDYTPRIVVDEKKALLKSLEGSLDSVSAIYEKVALIIYRSIKPIIGVEDAVERSLGRYANKPTRQMAACRAEFDKGFGKCASRVGFDIDAGIDYAGLARLTVLSTQDNAEFLRMSAEGFPEMLMGTKKHMGYISKHDIINHMPMNHTGYLEAEACRQMFRSSIAEVAGELAFHKPESLAALKEYYSLRKNLKGFPSGWIIVEPAGGMVKINPDGESLLGQEYARLRFTNLDELRCNPDFREYDILDMF